jgi:hypothetical protein
LLVVLLVAATHAAPASASTLVYQCGEAICATDPDTGAVPQQLTPSGRLAGLTRDGRTASWVTPSGIVQAPVAGGAPQTVFTGEVVVQPSMSPDGTRYLYSYAGPDGLGGFNAIWINRIALTGQKVEDISFCFYCATSHGWLNDLSIAAFPRSENGLRPSQVCRVASNEEVPGVGESCVQVLATDTRGGIAFPSGNAAGSEVVAALSPGERMGIRGRIVRYSLATGAPIADVTTGATDTTPAFSLEGDRVAFERDGQIMVKDLAGGAERVIGPGVYPFWGGSRTVQAPAPEPAPMSDSVRARSTRGGRVLVRVTCSGACRIRASLRISPATARRLGLGRRRTIATASGSRSRAGTSSLRLRVLRKAVVARSYKATLTVSINPAEGPTTRVTKALRVRR